MYRLAILVALVPCVFCQVILNGTCDTTIKGKEDFHFSQLSGKWYAIEGASLEVGQCHTVEFKPSSNETVMRYDYRVSVKNYPYIWSTIATGTTHGEMFIGAESAPFLVLDTDYTSYMLVYRCSKSAQTGEKMITAFKYSRDKQLSDIQKSALSVTINQHADLREHFWKTYHHTCNEDSYKDLFN